MQVSQFGLSSGYQYARPRFGQSNDDEAGIEIPAGLHERILERVRRELLRSDVGRTPAPEPAEEDRVWQV